MEVPEFHPTEEVKPLNVREPSVFWALAGDLHRPYFTERTASIFSAEKRKHKGIKHLHGPQRTEMQSSQGEKSDSRPCDLSPGLF